MTLDLDLDDMSIFADKSDINVISWVIKARAELIYLNYCPKTNKNFNCSVCTLQELETVFHFIAIIQFYRRAFFGKPKLSKHKFEAYPNGKDLRSLTKYLKKAHRKIDLSS